MPYLKKFMTESDLTAMRKSLSANPFRVADELRCDFCALNPPIVLYASARLTTGQWQRCWRWSACASCSQLIENSVFDALLSRCYVAVEKGFQRQGLGNVPKHLIEEAVKNSMQQFYDYAIPVEEEPKESVRVKPTGLRLDDENPRGE